MGGGGNDYNYPVINNSRGSRDANIITTWKHDEFHGTLPLWGFLDRADRGIKELLVWVGMDSFVYAGGARVAVFFPLKTTDAGQFWLSSVKINALQVSEFPGDIKGLKTQQKTTCRKNSVKTSKMYDSASFASILIIASEAKTYKPDLKNLNCCRWNSCLCLILQSELGQPTAQWVNWHWLC